MSSTRSSHEELSPYRWWGEPALAEAIADRLSAEGVDCRTFDTQHGNWDYGSYVPLHYMDPESSVPIVLLPTVLCSDVDENRKVGRLVHEVGKDTHKKLVFVSSCALSHDVARGPERWPTEERQSLDRKFIELTTGGRWRSSWRGCPSSFATASPKWEAGRFRAWSAVSRPWPRTNGELVGKQFGPYAQSSGSGNAHIAVFPKTS